MNVSNNLPDFLAHISTEERTKPLYQFRARVAIKDKVPTFANTLPGGDVLVYPGYLTFLTLSKYEPGAKVFFVELIDRVAAEYQLIFKLTRWVENPTAILNDLSKWLSSELKDEDRLAQALVNPNSLYIPFGDIMDVSCHRSLSQGMYMEVILKNNKRKLIIYQDTEISYTWCWEYITQHWQRECLSYLINVAKNNQKKQIFQ